MGCDIYLSGYGYSKLAWVYDILGECVEGAARYLKETHYLKGDKTSVALKDG